MCLWHMYHRASFAVSILNHCILSTWDKSKDGTSFFKREACSHRRFFSIVNTKLEAVVVLKFDDGANRQKISSLLLHNTIWNLWYIYLELSKEVYVYPLLGLWDQVERGWSLPWYTLSERVVWANIDLFPKEPPANTMVPVRLAWDF